MPRISVAQLFDDNRGKLRLEWIAGRDGGIKLLDSGNLKDSQEGLIGHLNFIHPNWIQVLARPEIDHLNAPRRISCTGDRRPAREVVAVRNLT